MHLAPAVIWSFAAMRLFAFFMIANYAVGVPFAATRNSKRLPFFVPRRIYVDSGVNWLLCQPGVCSVKHFITAFNVFYVLNRVP